ncbi:putative nuclease HARBI1 [Pecten maximus]|uniref:putative nuclease HARBI1 n=1 Tax=Pecten maximus TaxID=6579 RepID=UPI0014580E49|nr:putative nuclease HARBI1 [Pecten maximus]
MAGRNRQRVFQERKDPLQLYEDKDLIARYRMNAFGIRFVSRMLRPYLESPTDRNHALSVTVKVAIGLRFLATGKMQLCNGDDFGVSQPTVSRVVTQFINALTMPQIVARFIKFPRSDAEVRLNQIGFHAIAGFPGIVGVIDGTHIRIVAPSQNEAD